MLNELKIQPGYDEETAKGGLVSLYIIVYKGKVYLLNYEEKEFVQKVAKLASDLGLKSDGRTRILNFDDATDVLDNILHTQIPGLITVTIDDTGFSGYDMLLDVKWSSHFDPRQSTELPKLLRMFPGIKKFRVGRTVYDAAEYMDDFIKNKVAESKMPQTVYHGTLFGYVNDILKYGIKATPEHSQWTRIKHTNIIFLTSTFETAANYAKSASVKKSISTTATNMEVVLEIDATKLDPAKMLIDYDFYAELINSGIPDYDKFLEDRPSGMWSYFIYTDKGKFSVDTEGHKGSLYNKFGYKGVVMPSWIKAVYINDGKGYVKHSPADIKNLIMETTKFKIHKMKHIKIFENYNSNKNYRRVIPRDLFNEAKLLKCMGRLILKIHEGEAPGNMTFEHDGSPFEIALTNDGSLTVTNVMVFINDQPYEFHTTYNSKSNYPMYLWDHEEMVEFEVFDDNGEFTKEFIEFCESK